MYLNAEWITFRIMYIKVKGLFNLFIILILSLFLDSDPRFVPIKECFVNKITLLELPLETKNDGVKIY